MSSSQPLTPPAGLWVVLGASIVVACGLAFANQLMQRAARRVARTEKFQRISRCALVGRGRLLCRALLYSAVAAL